MQFTTGTLTRCSPSGGHYHIEVTSGGVTKEIHFTAEEMSSELADDTYEELRERVLHRLRSAAKEAGATTFAQGRTAVSNKTFHI